VRNKRHLGGLILAALLAVSAGGAVQAGDVETSVLASQDRRFSLTAGGDLDELEAMLTEDMNYTHSHSGVDTRARFLESLRSGGVRYVSIEPEERSVRVYGDAAVVQGVAHVLVKVQNPDRDIDVRLRFSELYVKQDGAWKMALWHSTTVP
jgi:hypothetical protein